jgi:hypothetical protein
MLSVFPELLFLAPLSAFIIRFALGVVLGYTCVQHFEKKGALLRTVATVEAVVAVALVVGAWTQIAAVITILLLGSHFALLRLRVVALGTALLALVMAVTLLLTGAGPFAFDLPL